VLKDLLAWAQAADEALFRLLNTGWVNPAADWFMPWVSEVRLYLVPLIALAAWLALRQGVRGRYVLLGLASLFLLTDWVTTSVWRPLFSRLRPYAALEGARVLAQTWRLTDAAFMAQAADSFGLPSAHAANSLGLAVYLGRFYRKLGLGLAGLALLVGLSRIYLGVHYPGDLLAGYAWGGLSGWAVARLVAGAARKWAPAEDSRFSGRGLD